MVAKQGGFLAKILRISQNGCKTRGGFLARVRDLIPRLFGSFIFLSMHVLEMLHLPSNFVYFSSLTFFGISLDHMHEKRGTLLFFRVFSLVLVDFTKDFLTCASQAPGSRM